MTRLVIEGSRIAAVHAPAMAAQLREEMPGAVVEAIRLSQGVPVTDEQEAAARSAIRARYGLAPDALLFGVFGGLTPEKRVPQILDAFAATRAAAPSAHLLLAGATARHYDAAAGVESRGLSAHVTITGYLDTDDELTACIAACDVVLNLRWPTAREVSGPWLRAIAAGKPTVTIDLAHLWDVPSLDPRTWTANDSAPRPLGPAASRPPVTVAIDILDEDHSLRLAMRRLATDAALRQSLGNAAGRYWQQEHALEASVADYHRVMSLALERAAPRAALPPHLINRGDQTLRALLEPFGLPVPLEYTFADSIER